MTDPQTLLLLDGHSLAYRAFFALPVENFNTSDGQPTNAVYGFTSMLINLLRDEQPTHIAVAFDLSRQSFRTEQYDGYKAKRSASPDEFKGQVSLIQEVLDALHIEWITAQGYEADDIIATLTSRARAADLDVLVVSGDRDSFQLIDDHVTVLYPIRGVSELSRMDPAAVSERYGVPPNRYRHLAALVGEASDNLSGVPGVGPKTAAKWLSTYTSLEGIVEDVESIKGKAGDSLREYLPDVLRNYSLNLLLNDLDLGVEMTALERQSWDRDEVHKVFDSLQFRVLRDRLYATLSAVAPEAADDIEFETSIVQPGMLKTWLSAHASATTRVGLAPRGSWGRGSGNLTGLAFAVHDGAATYLPIPVSGLDPADDEALGQWLANENVPKVLHDSKGPLLAVAAQGWSIANLASDTALAAYLVAPGQRSFDLADLVLRHVHRELQTVDETGAQQLTLDGGADEADEAIAAEQIGRAVGTVELSVVLDKELAKRGGTALLHDMELPLAQLLVQMEIRGIAADVEYLESLSSQFGNEVRAVADDAYSVIGQQINLGSPKQLQVVLFEQLDLPKTKRIKSGYTTDADALRGLLEQTQHPFLEYLMRHRDVSRLKSVVDGLIPMIDDVGRIHTTFQQTIAATGRLSSTDPNVQNIPVRSAEGRQIRKSFIVSSGYEALMTADYSQIEMRIMADLSADTGLIEAFSSGEDLHTFVASRAFGIDGSQVDPEMRRRIKAMSYGLAYGLSAYGLSQQLRITPAEAREQMDSYFERFGGVRDYLHDVVEDARVCGYTETIMGRRRYLPDLTSDNRMRREMAERMALNAPIQGSAADIIKVAMLNVEKALTEATAKSRMLLQVHDELVLEIASGEREQVEQIVRHEMASAYELSVPLEVSIGFGVNWDAAAH